MTFRTEIGNAVYLMLSAIEPPDNDMKYLREGLRETPDRVARAFEEWFSGYHDNPAEILAKNFKNESRTTVGRSDADYVGASADGIVLIRDIPFRSTCEHHMAPFTGVCHIGYIPDQHIVGLSKMPRLVECFAHRLQMQERMTEQIIESIDTIMAPTGVIVVTCAEHTCMTDRGVKAHGSSTSYSAARGAFFKNPAARSEFFSLLNLRK